MKRTLIRSAQIREVSGDGRNLTALAVAYNVVDSYGTIFLPGCFADSLAERLPALTWGHDWAEPVGRVIAFKDTPEGLVIQARFSDPEAVPRAKQAMAQIRDGDIEDVSVGFSVEEERQDDEGHPCFVRATLNEVACVLRGAVPNAKVLALRSQAKVSVITQDDAATILAEFSARLDSGVPKAEALIAALQALEAKTIVQDVTTPTDNTVDEPTNTTPIDEVDGELDALVEEAISALEGLK